MTDVQLILIILGAASLVRSLGINALQVAVARRGGAASLDFIFLLVSVALFIGAVLV